MVKHNHLFHLDNTKENRQLIKDLNKNMKEHNSLHSFRIKYRKPKPGHKYGYGGSLKQENALMFAVYLKGSGVCDSERANLNSQIAKLGRRNSLLMNMVYMMNENIAKHIEMSLKSYLRILSNRASSIAFGSYDDKYPGDVHLDIDEVNNVIEDNRRDTL